MNLKKIFDKKRYVFLAGFAGVYVVTLSVFLIIGFLNSQRSFKFAGSEIDETLTIEEKVIYEGNNVTIKQIDFNKDAITGNELTLEIINNSDTKYYVRESLMAVNKIMTAPYSSMYTEILPDSTSLLYITVPMQENNLCGITDIGEIVFDLNFYTDEGSFGVSPTVGFIVEDILIQTNHYGSIPELKDIEGKAVYNQDNILVTVEENNLFAGNEAKVSIQNNNDENIVFTVVKFAVDGNEIEGTYVVTVRADSRVVSSSLQLTYPEDINEKNLSVEAVAGVYYEGGTVLASKPYRIVWK